MQSESSRSEVCTEYGLDENRPVVLVVSQYFARAPMLFRTDPYEAMGSACRELEKIDPTIQCLVLAHPEDSVDILKDVLCRSGASNAIVRKGKGDYRGLYEASRLLVGVFSNCLLESMLVGRPIVTLDYVFFDFAVPQLIERGAVFPVLRKWDLADQLRRALTDEEAARRTIANQRDLYIDLFHYPDGRAGERAAAAIAELL